MHAIPTRAWSDTVASCQVEPVQVAARPSRLAATQNVVEAHEIACPGTLCAKTVVAVDKVPVQKYA